MKKVNIAELLKDCPQGMELDCTICNNVVTLEGVDTVGTYPIRVVSKSGFHHILTCEGYVYAEGDAKCVIFPKGKTTWEEFVPPVEFKDGDILTTITGSIFIYKKIDVYNYCGTYASLDIINGFLPTYYSYLVDCCRLATEEEKEKLFKAIRDNGYKWNEETKTLEKLIQPKFNVGDRVKSKINQYEYTIVDIRKDVYIMNYATNKFNYHVPFCNEDNFELVPNKFDINTLVPFESKVLVRNAINQLWIPAFWGYKDVDGFITTFGWCKYCIPYEGNESLFKTNSDCDDYFKTWKK